jgi:hypothetical protein
MFWQLRSHRSRAAVYRNRRNRVRPIVTLLEDRWLLSTYIVNNPGDAALDSAVGPAETADGTITLRSAIQQVNIDGSGTIKFAEAMTISPTSPLPDIYVGVDIDGTTAPGYEVGTPVITIDGSDVNTYGLTLAAAGSTIEGLAIGNFGASALYVLGSSNTIVADDLGTNAGASSAEPNASDGIDVYGNDNTIGGTAAADRNVISGNGDDGVWLGDFSTGNVVEGNFIGTDGTGTVALPNAYCGFQVYGSANTIGGTTAGARNVISGNTIDGVQIDPAPVGDSDNVVEGNYIGLDSAGTVAVPNALDGVLINGSPGNTIGGTAAGAGNVISGNGASGVEISGAESSGTIVEGDLIGTDSTGTAVVAGATGYAGVMLDFDASDNTIGGTAAGARNVISGNGTWGIDVDTSDNTVQGNFLGTDYSGSSALSDQDYGVSIVTSGNMIGGTTAAASNVISGNSVDGIVIDSTDGSDNAVEGNLIGTDYTGAFPVGNGGGRSYPWGGVVIDQGASDNTIGGTSSGDANIIAFNVGTGVTVGINDTDDATGNAIFGNSIYSNSDLGIDVGNDGLTLNDSSGHSGPNLFQNFPVVAAATIVGPSASISGTLSSTPNARFTIQFFASNVADYSDYAEGQTYLGDILNATTDSSGNYDFNDVQFPAAPVGQDVITATATDRSGDTSEFSLPFTAQVTAPIMVTNTTDSEPGSLRAAIEYANTQTTPQTIIFAIPGNGVQTIEPATALPEITTPVFIDGASEQGYAESPIIQIDGSQASNDAGLWLAAGSDGSTIQGLEITDWDTGIVIGSTDNQVIGSFIGLTTSAITEPNSYGVYITGSQNTIGGTTAGTRNVISGNVYTGVQFSGASADENVVEGDYIGVDYQGYSATGNYTGVGFEQGASENTIGGTALGAGDVISGNTNYGIDVDDGSYNVVAGDYIGVNRDGSGAVGNNFGVDIASGVGNTIGGTTFDALDVISGNVDNGVELDNQTTYWNVVEGDFIGTDVTGEVSLPNGYVGVQIDQGAQQNTIGGTATGATNVIAGNYEENVAIYGAQTSENVVEGDYIGVDPTGKVALTSGTVGVSIFDGASDNTIGGSNPSAGNLISGDFFGVELNGMGTTGNAVERNTIGLDIDGNALPNQYGVDIDEGASGNTIGGIAGESNVISGNANDGVDISGSDNVVSENYIGIDSSGGVDGAAVGNSGSGIELSGSATGNTIGGTNGLVNVISGNGYDGVELNGPGTIGNVVEENDIGTDSTGGVDGLAVPNENDGVEINFGARDNTIGGTAGNLISGNAVNGVEIEGADTTGNVVARNSIGLDYQDRGAVPNSGDGIRIDSGASGNTIGGTGGGLGNQIANNYGNGVTVGSGQTDASTENAILGNSIFGNAELGIDLGDDGVTPNHSSPTTGIIAGAPNGDQNFPVLSSATFVPDVSDSNGTLILSGSLAADQSSTFTVQVFADPGADGQGTVLIASFPVTTDSSGNAIFSQAIPDTENYINESITATVTDSNGNTSEFALDAIVRGGAGATVTVPLGDTQAAMNAALEEVVSALQSLPAGTTLPALLLDVTSVAELDSVVPAINGITSQASPAITVIVDLGGGKYMADTKLDPPSGIDVVVQNGTLVGGSPAFIVTGGTVALNHVTATNATSAPTILVNGGSLTVRNSTIDGSPVVGEAAFSITGGTLDLGTSGSPGGNTINVSTDDQFVQSATSTPIPTVGDTFTVSGAVQTATELSFASLTGPASPSAQGQSVTFTATVVPDYPGDSAPTGYVYFVDLTTGNTLGMVKLTAGTAALSTTTLPVGSNEIVARYFGDSRYLLSISGTFNQTVTAARALTNVTADLSIKSGGFIFNRKTAQFAQSLTITNTSDAAITGPIELVFENLKNATLANQTGTYSGTPYITILSSGSLGVGQSLTVSLIFADPTLQAITYTSEFLAGPIPPPS